MKALGNKSISSFLKRIITIVFYLEFLLVLTLPLVFMDDDGLRYSWPITLNSRHTTPVVTANKPEISGFVIHDRYQVADQTKKKVLSFEDGSLGRKFLQTLNNIVTIIILLLVTFWLKKIFSSLSANKPFTDKNSKRVQWIAWAILILVLFDVIKAFLYRAYTDSTLSLTGASLDIYDYSFDLRALLLGLLLLIIAELFKRGNEYQTDSESIV